MGQIIIKTEATKKHKAIGRDIVIAECICDVRKYLTFIYVFSGCNLETVLFVMLYGGKNSINLSEIYKIYGNVFICSKSKT